MHHYSSSVATVEEYHDSVSYHHCSVHCVVMFCGGSTAVVRRFFRVSFTEVIPSMIMTCNSLKRVIC